MAGHSELICRFGNAVTDCAHSLQWGLHVEGPGAVETRVESDSRQAQVWLHACTAGSYSIKIVDALTQQALNDSPITVSAAEACCAVLHPLWLCCPCVQHGRLLWTAVSVVSLYQEVCMELACW